MQSQSQREQISSFIFGINRKVKTMNLESTERGNKSYCLQDTVLSDVQKDWWKQPFFSVAWELYSNIALPAKYLSHIPTNVIRNLIPFNEDSLLVTNTTCSMDLLIILPSLPPEWRLEYGTSIYPWIMFSSFEMTWRFTLMVVILYIPPDCLLFFLHLLSSPSSFFFIII